MCLCMRINEQLLKGGRSRKNLARHPSLTSRSSPANPPPPLPPHLLSLIKDRILTQNNLVSRARVTLIQGNGQRGRYFIYDSCNVVWYISSLPYLLMVIIVYRVFLVLTIRIAAFGNEIGRRIARFLPDGRAALLMTFYSDCFFY